MLVIVVVKVLGLDRSVGYLMMECHGPFGLQYWIILWNKIWADYVSLSYIVAKGSFYILL